MASQAAAVPYAAASQPSPMPGGGAGTAPAMHPQQMQQAAMQQHMAMMRQMQMMQAQMQAAAAAASRGFPFGQLQPGYAQGAMPSVGGQMAPGAYGYAPYSGAGDATNFGGSPGKGAGRGKGFGKGFKGKGKGKSSGRGSTRPKGEGEEADGDGEAAGEGSDEEEGARASRGQPSVISQAQRSARLRFEKDVLDRIQGRWTDESSPETTYTVEGNLVAVAGAEQSGRVFRNRLGVYGYEICWDARRFWHYLDLQALYAAGDQVDKVQWAPGKDSPPTQAITWLRAPPLPEGEAEGEEGEEGAKAEGDAAEPTAGTSAAAEKEGKAAAASGTVAPAADEGEATAAAVAEAAMA